MLGCCAATARRSPASMARATASPRPLESPTGPRARRSGQRSRSATSRPVTRPAHSRKQRGNRSAPRCPMIEHSAHGAVRASEALAPMKIGRRSLIAISDGYIDMLPTLIGTPESPTAAHDALKDESGSYFMPIGCFVVPGEPTVLIDLGL